MKKGYTDINIILDRSGSMCSVLHDTIGGFNAFLAEQKRADGQASLTLTQFDNEYEVVYSGKDITEVADLDEETFVPRGMTALYDAIGRTVNATGERLAAMDEADRPENVIIVIITDGGENASREFRGLDVMEKTKHQTETYNWDFVFLGANQDAISVGAQLGVLGGNSLTYASNAQGTHEAFSSISKSMTSYRSGDISMKSSFFADEDRAAQTKAGA